MISRQDIYYHNIVYKFLAHSQPKTLVVPHQINILLQNRYYLIISEKQREKKRKNRKFISERNEWFYA